MFYMKRIFMKRAKALRYLREHPTGEIADLKTQIDAKIIKEFELTGIIKRGQEADRSSSYEFTENGREIDKYANWEEFYNPSVFDKIQNFLTGIFIDRRMISV